MNSSDGGKSKEGSQCWLLSQEAMYVAAPLTKRKMQEAVQGFVEN